MKRYLALVMALLLTTAVMITGCGNLEKSVFGSETNDDNTVDVTATNASEESEANGLIKVAEDEEIVIDYDLEGEIEIRFYDPSDSKHAEPLSEFTCSGTDQGIVGFGAGEFDVFSKVTKKATGTIRISTQKIGEEPGSDKWTEAKTAEEAAKGAGLDMFEYGDGSEISLGKLQTEKIEYMDGICRADIPVAAVDIKIYKGLAKENDGDVSFDENKYKREWTQNIKGLEVQCFGNRSAEATKVIWTVDDYSYAITADGMGGDDDFGLSPDDVSSIVNAIQ